MPSSQAHQARKGPEAAQAAEAGKPAAAGAMAGSGADLQAAEMPVPGAAAAVGPAGKIQPVYHHKRRAAGILRRAGSTHRPAAAEALLATVDLSTGVCDLLKITKSTHFVGRFAICQKSIP